MGTPAVVLKLKGVKMADKSMIPAAVENAQQQ
jgi:hypothetical protein